MKTLVLSALLACSAGGGSDDADGDGGSADGGSADGGVTDGGVTDGGTTDGGADGGTADLNGSTPDEALPAPDFAATNMDGAARDREDVLGHPTVMWFYPAAGTAG